MKNYLSWKIVLGIGLQLDALISALLWWQQDTDKIQCERRSEVQDYILSWVNTKLDAPFSALLQEFTIL